MSETETENGENGGEEFVQQPSDETVAAGEHINWDQLAEEETNPGGVVNPYAPPEEQGMELQPKVFGPPQYGSPDPVTSASRLVTLEDGHPLDPGVMPEDHPSAISEDYAVGTVDPVDGEETAPADEEVNATDGAKELAEAEGVDLSQVEGSGAEGRIVKGDVEDYIAERDNA